MSVPMNDLASRAAKLRNAPAAAERGRQSAKISAYFVAQARTALVAAIQESLDDFDWSPHEHR